MRQKIRDLSRVLWRAHIRFWAKKLEFDKSDKIMVIAPHADDETLGSGGLIKICTDAGIEVFVICVNDGRFSHSEDLIDPDQLVEIREEEFISSLKLLGVDENHADFTGLNQAEMFDNKEWLNNIEEQINKFEPTIIVLPDYMDTHEDHSYISREVSKLDHAAEILYAPIWHLVYGPKLRIRPYLKALFRHSLYIDISAVLDDKRKAWKNYKSQSGQFNDVENWNYLDENWSKHHMNKKEIYFKS